MPHLPGHQSSLPTPLPPPLSQATPERRVGTPVLSLPNAPGEEIGVVLRLRIGSGSSVGRCLRAANTFVYCPPPSAADVSQRMTKSCLIARGRKDKCRNSSRIVAGLRGGRAGTSLSRICRGGQDPHFLGPHLSLSCRQPRAPHEAGDRARRC